MSHAFEHWSNCKSCWNRIDATVSTYKIYDTFIGNRLTFCAQGFHDDELLPTLPPNFAFFFGMRISSAFLQRWGYRYGYYPDITP